MYRKEKKIPTPVALLLLIAGIGLTLFLDNNRPSYLSQAGNTPKPQNVQFSNITDNSFTVSWLTESNTTGLVKVNGNNIRQAFFEDFDTDEIARPRAVHYVSLKNLDEGTDYNIQIVSGKSDCTASSKQENCPAFTQKTGLKITSRTSLPPLHGAILHEDETPVPGAVVYLKIGNGSPLSAKTDSAGLWVIPLTSLRSADYTGNLTFSDSDIAQIKVYASTKESAEGVIDLKTIRENSLPLNMKIGRSYNFIDLYARKELLLAQNGDNKVLGSATVFPSVTISPIAGKQIIPAGKNLSVDPKSAGITIQFPKNDSDTTPDQQPKLWGTGKAGNKLLITVNSTPQIVKVTVGNNGVWSWRPGKPLEPGRHHISVQGTDENGKQITLVREFFVLKSGESVLGEATASASLTPTGSPSPTPAGITPTSTPRVSLSATPVPSITPAVITPSVTPSPTRQIPTATVTPTMISGISPTPPRTGNIGSTYIIFGGSIALLLLGLKFFVF